MKRLFCPILFIMALASTSPVFATPSVIYVDTYNNGDRMSRIWSYNVASGKTLPIFALENTTLPATVTFPPPELALLRTYTKDVASQEGPMMKDWGEQDSPDQTIQGLWRFDATRLLIQTTNDLQDGFRRGADNDESGRFGYHELLTVDLTDTRKVVSLLKIDYHNKIFQEWGEPAHCVRSFVYIDDIALNPSQKKMAFNVHSARDWCTNFPKHSLLIADYSSLPAKLTDIPMADNPVWSPDGTRLAYSHMTCTGSNTNHEDCSLSLKVLNIADGTTRTILPDENMTIPMNESFVWVDNQTLVYLWVKSCIGDCDFRFMQSYNLETNQRSDMIEADIDSICGLGSSTPMLISGNNIYSPLSPFENTASLEATGDPICNTRFPDQIAYADLYGGTTPVTLTIVDKNLHLKIVDFSKIWPPSEWLVAVAP